MLLFFHNNHSVGINCIEVLLSFRVCIRKVTNKMSLKFEISLCTINVDLGCWHYYVGIFISCQLCLIPRIFYTIACFIFIVYLLMVCAVEMITQECLCATTKNFLRECNNRFVFEFGAVWKLSPDSTRLVSWMLSPSILKFRISQNAPGFFLLRLSFAFILDS